MTFAIADLALSRSIIDLKTDKDLQISGGRTTIYRNYDMQALVDNGAKNIQVIGHLTLVGYPSIITIPQV